MKKKRVDVKSEIQSSSDALDSLPFQLSNRVHPESFLDSIFLSDNACNHDAIVIIEQPGVSFPIPCDTISF